MGVVGIAAEILDVIPPSDVAVVDTPGDMTTM